MQSSAPQLPKPSFSEAVRRAREAILSSAIAIRRRFGEKPISLMRMVDPTIRFPKKLRIIFACIWKGQDLQGRPASRFIMKGPRGGGKTKILSAVSWCIWFLRGRNTIDLGGSLTQAQELYRYFVAYCYASSGLLRSLPAEPTISKTLSDMGSYFRAVAASQKAVRGPHPDTLLIDEMCEVKDELALSAIPSVMSSQFPLIILASTFHKIFGLFQEIWDNADALGYVRFSWDIFDVCAQFDPAIWDDKRLNMEIPDLQQLKERAAGRTGDPEGWVSIHSIIQMWREKQSLDWFDVECMGSRPSVAGLINNPEDVDACTIDEFGEYAYVRGADTAGGLDWGFSGMSAWSVGMKHKDDVVVLLNAHDWSQVRSGVIIEDIVEDVMAYRITKIHADASHPFENADLRAAIKKAIEKLPEHEQFVCTLVEIPFGRPLQVAENDGKKKGDGSALKKDIKKNLGTEKEFMLGNYKAYFTRRLLRILRSFKVPLWQHKRYRYQKGSDKPEKEDDHHPDATMLMLRKWVLGKMAGKLSEENPETRREKSTHTTGLLDTRF